MKWLLINLFFLPLGLFAQFNVAEIFSDNMILQREKPLHIWGKGIPGDEVIVSFSGEVKTTAINNDSTWSVFLKKQPANPAPQALQLVSGNKKIIYTNILIGDIWLCSGQSNMEWPMNKELHWTTEKQETNQPLIRFINPPPAGRNVYGIPFSDSLIRRLHNDSFYLWNGWKNCDSNTISAMSAVGYFFAKNIVSEEKIPVGLINLSIGGAPIETFISKETLQSDTTFRLKAKGNWLVNDNLPEWVRERGIQNVGSTNKGYQGNTGPNHAYKPGFAFEKGIEPILPLPIKGVLWYQGESNSLEIARVKEYRKLLQLLITDYRKKWEQNDMPFYWVQLSSIDTSNYKSHYWPLFRDEQRILLNEMKNTGMAVSSDLGLKDDVHPRNKKQIGYRLARWALSDVYHKKIIPSGPLPVSAKYKKNRIVLRFKYAGKYLKTSDGNKPGPFTTESNRQIEATIRGKKIVLNTKEKPEYIHYGWQPFSEGNLINNEGLPASTFQLKVE